MVRKLLPQSSRTATTFLRRRLPATVDPTRSRARKSVAGGCAVARPSFLQGRGEPPCDRHSHRRKPHVPARHSPHPRQSRLCRWLLPRQSGRPERLRTFGVLLRPVRRSPRDRLQRPRTTRVSGRSRAISAAAQGHARDPPRGRQALRAGFGISPNAGPLDRTGHALHRRKRSATGEHSRLAARCSVCEELNPPVESRGALLGRQQARCNADVRVCVAAGACCGGQRTRSSHCRQRARRRHGHRALSRSGRCRTGQHPPGQHAASGTLHRSAGEQRDRPLRLRAPPNSRPAAVGHLHRQRVHSPRVARRHRPPARRRPGAQLSRRQES